MWVKFLAHLLSGFLQPSYPPAVFFAPFPLNCCCHRAWKSYTIRKTFEGSHLWTIPTLNWMLSDVGNAVLPDLDHTHHSRTYLVNWKVCMHSWGFSVGLTKIIFFCWMLWMLWFIKHPQQIDVLKVSENTQRPKYNIRLICLFLSFMMLRMKRTILL